MYIYVNNEVKYDMQQSMTDRPDTVMLSFAPWENLLSKV